MKLLIDRLCKLLTVKSIVTIMFSIALCVYIFIHGKSDDTLTYIVTTVIGYYFGTQKLKE
jgi:hypothetical protein